MNRIDFEARVNAVASSEAAGFRRFIDAVENSRFARADGSVIIYIEDDPDQVSMFKTMVAKYSRMLVLPAFTSEDGKALLKKKNGRTKCVVMDIGLEYGAGEGMDLLDWIKENYPTVPVMVLTGHAELASPIHDRYPDVEVHIKANESIEHLVKSIETVALGA